MDQALSTLLANGALGAIVAFIGVLVAQSRTTRRQQQALREARSLEENRAQAEALRDYFEQIGKLLIDPERPLRLAAPGDDLSVLVRAQTLSVLTSLKSPMLPVLGAKLGYTSRVRRGILLRFLYEAGLIDKGKPVVRLFGSDMTNTLWFYATLQNADLRGADLSKAMLIGADLSGADLSRALLRGADLTNADLRGANLRETDLSSTDLALADNTPP